MKITIKLTAIFLMISLIPISIISFTYRKAAENMMRSYFETNFKLTAKEKADSIDFIVRERISEVERLASTKRVIDAVKESYLVYPNKPNREILHTINQIDKEWIDSKGDTEIAHQILNNGLSIFFRKYQSKNPSKYGEIFVTDAQGTAVAMTSKLSDYYQADEEWWENSFDKGKGKVFLDSRGFDISVGALVLGVVVPVRHKGEVIGILKINYKVRRILDIVAAARIGETSEALIVNSQGDIVVYSGAFQREGLTEFEKSLLNETDTGWIEEAHNHDNTVMVHSLISSEFFTRVIAPGSTKGVSGERWEPSKWYLFLEIGHDEAYALGNKMRNMLSVTGLLVAISVIFMALFIARSLSKPIQKLTRSAKTIGEGNLEYRVDINREDEIGQLAAAFNQMTEKLQVTTVSRDHLAEEITERKRAEEALKESERELSIMNQISDVFLTVPDDEMYGEVLKVFLEATESKHGVFGYIDESGGFVVPSMTQHIWDECQVEEKTFTFPQDTWGDSTWPQAIREKRTIYSNDPSTNIPEGHISIRRHISLPIIYRGEVIGLSQVANKETDYDEKDIKLYEAIAEKIAPILHARLQRDREEIERKRAEEEVRKHTVELAAVNQELEAFNYSVSHDLRAPLRGIDGFSQVLLEDYSDKLDAQGKDALQRVRAASQRMGLMVDDLLSLSRVTRSEMRSETVDLSELAKTIAARLQQTQPERPVEFVIEEGVTSKGDGRLLRVVLENLLGNAWKFAGKKPLTRIEFGLTEHDGKPAYFVRDNGAGFDMAYADKLFGAFQRLHAIDEFEGTGVGLATAQRIIHRHGGRIWAEGAVEQGATFKFTL